MGKRVILAADGPGLPRQPLRAPVRRPRRCGCSRSAWPRTSRSTASAGMGGGFRMGPFELMDLVGIDVGFEVAKSFNELSFGEPRWQPSPIQARMVAAGRLGRKTGRGYYDYADDGSYRPEDPEPPAPGGGDGTLVAIVGDGPLADGLRERARAAGYDAARGRRRPSWSSTRGMRPDRAPCRAGRRCSRSAPSAAWPPAASRARSASTCCRRSSSSARRADPHCRAPSHSPPRRPASSSRGSASTPSGSRTRPGLVLGRIVCQLVNEAWFAVGEGVGSEEDVDAGLDARARTTRAGRSRGARRSGSSTWPRCSTGSGRSAARSATGPPRSCVAQLSATLG